jgi:xeroderma pigmentosum group C-complementing protein
MNAAKTRSGNRDVGAWLFTTLLRSVGVETRLICSLQPLQFGFLNEGSRQKFISLDSSEQSVSTGSNEMERDKSYISISSAHSSKIPSRSLKSNSVRNPTFPSSSHGDIGTYSNPVQYITETKTFSHNHPFFWSEAWDVASQKWITIEPMVGPRINQPSRIEPPGTAAPWESGAIGDNILTYVVGFDNSSAPKSGFAKCRRIFQRRNETVC